MSIRYTIAGPVAALGLIALAAAGVLLWLVGTATAVGQTDGSAARMSAGLGEIREAQRIASGIGAAVLGGPDAMKGSSVLHEAVTAAELDAAVIRALAAGQAYEPAADRLAAEIGSWREQVDRLAHQAAAPAPAGLVDAAEGLALRHGVILRLVDEIADGVVETEAAEAAGRRSALLRAGAALTGFIGLVALGFTALAFGFGGRLARALAAVPRDLQAFSGGAATGFPGEGRKDEIGTMARGLRAFAERMHELSCSRAEMERMALTDPLTGLPNRRGLYDFLAKCEGMVPTRRAGIAVLHIDLDHFKTVNDTNGHEAGDFVLQEATRRMALVIRESDILARIGGDEFVVFAQGITGSASLERLAERIVRQFEEPILFRDRTLRVTASVGGVLAGRSGRLQDPDRLLISADVALGHAKAGGRNRYALFTSAMARRVRRLKQSADEIREGIGRGEFGICFCPLVDMRIGRPSALQLLPRWHHPERGDLGPDDFMDAAEAHGLTEALALPVYERGLRAVSRWRAAGLAVPRLHLGMSRTLLLAPGVVDRLGWMLDQNQVEPENVAISIGERDCGGRGAEAVFANLRRLADRGSPVMIDDFGSVDAALGNVARLGATKIKIDLGGTAGLFGGARTGGREGSEALLSGIVRLGESLRVRVMAKGVTERETVEYLLARGITEMQGDAVAITMDEDATGAWLAARQRSAALLAAG